MENVGLRGKMKESKKVQTKLQRTCELYDMDYHYREGENCIEKDGTIHPIMTECPEPYQRGTCDIKFIKY